MISLKWMIAIPVVLVTVLLFAGPGSITLHSVKIYKTKKNDGMIQWSWLLNEERDVEIVTDQKSNSTVERLNTIKDAFHEYVSSNINNANGEPFSMMINSSEYEITNATSTTTLDHMSSDSAKQEFNASLRYQYRHVIPWMNYNVVVNLACTVEKANHNCTAKYNMEFQAYTTGMTIFEKIQFYIAVLMFIIVTSIFSGILSFLIYLCAVFNRLLLSLYLVGLFVTLLLIHLYAAGELFEPSAVVEVQDNVEIIEAEENTSNNE